MQATKQYTCTMDADDWQIFSFEGYERLEESKKAAVTMSGAMTVLVREAQVRLTADPCLSERKLAEQVRNLMHEKMNPFSDLGACDTEPSCSLVAELERAFGLDEYSLDRY